ncbi:MAG: hypothetical protein EB828_01450 [Nitrosopumilus sp. D6]|nr:MAG: hypothetical protein EB828_01450 [Nitrosopumilus sp. D6]
MKRVIVTVIIAVVAIAIAGAAVTTSSLFAPFGEVKDELDSMSKSTGEMTDITSIIKEKDVVMAFIDATPDGYDELFEETFVGEYTFIISALDDSSSLEVEYMEKTDTITSQIYTCTDSNGNPQSFDADPKAKIMSGEC